MAWYDFFLGTDPQNQKLDVFSPQQQGLQNQLIGGLGGQLSPALASLMKLIGDDEESFNKFAAPYLRNFKTQVVPGITERFSGGDSGASSGLFNALGEAGAGLEQGLASAREGMKGDALRSLFSLLQPAMQSPFGYNQIQAQPGLIQNLLSAFAGGVGQGVGRR